MLPVIYINLDASWERREFMQQQLDRLGVKARRVSAVEGRGGLPSWLPHSSFSTRLTSAEVGCYASHLVVHRSITRATIILEDDAAIADDIEEAALEAVWEAPEGWDVIHLSSTREGTPVALAGQRDIIRFTRGPMQATGYIISIEGARKMLSIKQRKRPIDMEFRYGVAGLNIYGLAPPPVRERGVASTIGERRGRSWKPSFIERWRGL